VFDLRQAATLARRHRAARWKRRLVTVIPLVPLVATGFALSAPSEAIGQSSNAIRHARTIVEEFIHQTGVPALQIAIGMDGEIVWSQAFGDADLQARKAATVESRFRIASVSKLLTGTLAAKLALAGVLDLDRPIGEYVPDLPETWYDITANMLLHHTSGIPHYANAEDARDTTFYATTRDALEHFRERPLVHAPGKGETYSSYAYTVLALAIEQVTGKPFLDVMQHEILDPLGMAHTGPDLNASPPPERTAFYTTAEDGSIEVAADIDLSGRWAGSGFLSTAEDLVRFGMAHTSSGSLPPALRDLVQQRLTLPDGEVTQEGMGWGPRKDWDGKAMLWGDGSTLGSRCGLLVYPEEDLVIAILTNLRGLSLERGESQTLARLFFAERQGQRPRPPSSRSLGDWRGVMTAGKDSVNVHLELTDPDTDAGILIFERWRSLTVADAFRLGEVTWIIAIDDQGIVPLCVTRDNDDLAASIPRFGLSFRLQRTTHPAHTH
jgi:CubicO group peptidase (beta-lactamase class C family)